MDVQIHAEDTEDLTALRSWLSQEDELRGRVRSVDAPIGDGTLGALPELLTVALGAGGAGTVLASSLKTWLLTRRKTAKLTVETEGRTISLDIATVDDIAPLLQQLFEAIRDK